MIKYNNKKTIEVQDWDELVKETYNRPYSFQQQDGCQDRGVYNITIPLEFDDSNLPDTVSESVNHEEMKVKFSSWLTRDPKQKLSDPNDQESWSINQWWKRNFYPDIQMVANDLYKKGLIEAGEYFINIDW